MKILFKILKYTLLSFFGLILLVLGFSAALYWSADMKQPDVVIDTTAYKVVDHGGYRQCDSAKLRQNSYGLWELYVEGSAVQRGVTMGALTADLLKYQESVFVDQIRQIVPSDGYLGFLRNMLIIFNRKLGKNVPQEYREEIYAISQYCTHEFDAIGTPYERQLNYHAAHDIGHTMQQYMLVGCSSFAAWGGESADSSLIVGRNFDFYVGDDFARNKIVMFFAPEKGYKFASVSWAGMIGVLSGMNEAGLTVTINAATGTIPTSAAMPISILVREILQYASTIDEAYAIASRHTTFVNESILVASAKDGFAAVIEKTPHKIDIYRSGNERIVCTNHYQSTLFANEAYNLENIEMSDSKYRYERLEELISQNCPISYSGAASVLRNRYGRGGADVGVGNEMTLNQSIAHHSVIFKPEKHLMWVSTSPWQSGAYICYDLAKIFAGSDFSKELNVSDLTIPEDSLFMTNDYPRLLEFRQKVKDIKALHGKADGQLEQRDAEQFINLNPNFFYTYQVLGDYYSSLRKCGSESERRRQVETSIYYYKEALKREIPRKNERETIENSVKKLEKCL